MSGLLLGLMEDARTAVDAACSQLGAVANTADDEHHPQTASELRELQHVLDDVSSRIEMQRLALRGGG